MKVTKSGSRKVAIPAPKPVKASPSPASKGTFADQRKAAAAKQSKG